MDVKTMKGSVLAAALMLTLGACTNETRSDVAKEETVRTERAVATESAPPPANPASRTSAPAAPVADVDRDGDLDVDDAGAGAAVTGVQACDDYLTSYRACHRVIGAYGEEDIERRYQSLRTSLIERSLDPAQHDALQQNCASLSSNMKDALAGRDCALEPAPVADTEELLDDEQ